MAVTKAGPAQQQHFIIHTILSAMLAARTTSNFPPLSREAPGARWLDGGFAREIGASMFAKKAFTVLRNTEIGFKQQPTELPCFLRPLQFWRCMCLSAPAPAVQAHRRACQQFSWVLRLAIHFCNHTNTVSMHTHALGQAISSAVAAVCSLRRHCVLTRPSTS